MKMPAPPHQDRDGQDQRGIRRKVQRTGQKQRHRKDHRGLQTRHQHALLGLLGQQAHGLGLDPGFTFPQHIVARLFDGAAQGANLDFARDRSELDGDGARRQIHRDGAHALDLLERALHLRHAGRAVHAAHRQDYAPHALGKRHAHCRLRFQSSSSSAKVRH